VSTESDWIAKVDQAVQQIREHSPDVEGCSAEDLARFQQDQKVELPLAYARFLAGVGRNMGEFLVGSDLWFRELPSQLETARALLEDDAGPELPPDAFVFCSHQGYQFLFFYLGEGPDPAVHYYLEGTARFDVVAPSFSSWLAGAVIDEFSGATE
jgi:hypothetical protein